LRDLDLDAAGNYSASAGYAIWGNDDIYICPCHVQRKPVLDITRVFIDDVFNYLPHYPTAKSERDSMYFTGILWIFFTRILNLYYAS
jgi:hypothetical protein